MTSVSNIQGVQGSVQAQQAPVASAQAPSASQSTTPISGSSQAVVSPRVVFDPQAGLITEYLNSSGKVTEQTPSAAAVAYLHAGLTAQGLDKVSPDGTTHRKSAVA